MGGRVGGPLPHPQADRREQRGEQRKKMCQKHARKVNVLLSLRLTGPRQVRVVRAAQRQPRRIPAHLHSDQRRGSAS